MHTPVTEQDYLLALLRDIASSDNADAIAKLNEAADTHANDARPMLLLAAEYAQQGAMDQAEAAYIGALQRAPDFAVARFQLGLLQFTSGRPAAAAATWQPLAQLPEGNEFRLFAVAMNHLAADRFDDAVQYIRLGMAANKTNSPLNVDMQRLLERILPLAQNADTTQDSATAEMPAGHFLLSSYRNLH